MTLPQLFGLDGTDEALLRGSEKPDDMENQSGKLAAKRVGACNLVRRAIMRNDVIPSNKLPPRERLSSTCCSSRTRSIRMPLRGVYCLPDSTNLRRHKGHHHA